MELLARTVGNAAGLWLAVALVAGLSVPGSPSLGLRLVNLLVLGLVLALVNSIIKPVAKTLTLPLYVVTLGLFALVVNGFMLLITSRLTDALTGVGSSAGVSLGLHVEGFGAAVIGSLIVSVVSAVVVALVGPRRD